MQAQGQQKKNKQVLLSAKKLCITQRRKEILKNIDLTLKEHDFITIIGPNGAGKSSLLKALMGVLPISSGMIKKKTGLRIGYVPQQFDVPATLPLTVNDFLKINNTHDELLIEAVMAELGTLSLKKKYMHQLSGGERQRILIVRALIKEPDLLVLDEPAQNLDMRGQVALYQFLTELYKNKKTSILMVSHDLHLVMSITTNVICLQGQICCMGQPKMITKDPAFIKIFGDELASMMSLYQHKTHNGEDHE